MLSDIQWKELREALPELEALPDGKKRWLRELVVSIDDIRKTAFAGRVFELTIDDTNGIPSKLVLAPDQKRIYHDGIREAVTDLFAEAFYVNPQSVTPIGVGDPALFSEAIKEEIERDAKEKREAEERIREAAARAREAAIKRQQELREAAENAAREKAQKYADSKDKLQTWDEARVNEPLLAALEETVLDGLDAHISGLTRREVKGKTYFEFNLKSLMGDESGERLYFVPEEGRLIFRKGRMAKAIAPLVQNAFGLQENAVTVLPRRVFGRKKAREKAKEKDLLDALFPESAARKAPIHHLKEPKKSIKAPFAPEDIHVENAPFPIDLRKTRGKPGCRVLTATEVFIKDEPFTEFTIGSPSGEKNIDGLLIYARKENTFYAFKRKSGGYAGYDDVIVRLADEFNPPFKNPPNLPGANYRPKDPIYTVKMVGPFSLNVGATLKDRRGGLTGGHTIPTTRKVADSDEEQIIGEIGASNKSDRFKNYTRLFEKRRAEKEAQPQGLGRRLWAHKAELAAGLVAGMATKALLLAFDQASGAMTVPLVSPVVAGAAAGAASSVVRRRFFREESLYDQKGRKEKFWMLKTAAKGLPAGMFGGMFGYVFGTIAHSVASAFGVSEPIADFFGLGPKQPLPADLNPSIESPAFSADDGAALPTSGKGGFTWDTRFSLEKMPEALSYTLGAESVPSSTVSPHGSGLSGDILDALTQPKGIAETTAPYTSPVLPGSGTKPATPSELLSRLESKKGFTL